jgi:hypothetical protein
VLIKGPTHECSHTPLLQQLVAEAALISTGYPTSRHAGTNVPEPHMESSISAGATPGDAKPSSTTKKEASRKLNEAEGSGKLASELRTLCTALLAIPDKLASVCCACPAPLRPRNLLPQLFSCIIHDSAPSTLSSSIETESGARAGSGSDGQRVHLCRTHVVTALSALITSATMRGHAEIVARWLHQQEAHAWLLPTARTATKLEANHQSRPEDADTDTPEILEEHSSTKHSHDPYACSTCMSVSSALAQVQETSCHERLWYALLEASVQKLETRKASNRSLVDMRVSTTVCAALWLRGTAHVLPQQQQVQFWVRLLTARRRLPPAALLHLVLVCFLPTTADCS